MPPVGFETTISAGERQQTHALDRSATGIGCYFTLSLQIEKIFQALGQKIKG
jgi:hypothetical protein